MVTLRNLLMELQTWCAISEQEIQDAERSQINENNNAEFRYFLMRYKGGAYDEDLPQLAAELYRLTIS